MLGSRNSREQQVNTLGPTASAYSVELRKVTQPGFEPGTTPNRGGALPTELSGLSSEHNC